MYKNADVRLVYFVRAADMRTKHAPNRCSRVHMNTFKLKYRRSVSFAEEKCVITMLQMREECEKGVALYHTMFWYGVRASTA